MPALRSAECGYGLLYCWFLLRHAVEGAESPDEVAGINWHDVAARKHIGQGVECDAVVGIVEDRDQHRSIRDIEIRVAGGQAPAFEDDWARHRNFYHVEALAILIARGSQASEVVVERGIIFILCVWLDHRDYRAGRDEAGEIVDVAMRVVSFDTFAEPDD